MISWKLTIPIDTKLNDGFRKYFLVKKKNKEKQIGSLFREKNSNPHFCAF